ncbi:N-acetyltransferase [Actinorhabdospora filicis]|uniref:N-acetyltransferase n=1 Tax=Actinorhabdospora filicis TaxID=1785913 RepID=A0A9W6SGS9_9ACTN|nr:GNAT family protein [Actinorhabdospora filicis]GLZ75587.1 N-acetyltransferase [Actinorhabdospora filicis]
MLYVQLDDKAVLKALEPWHAAEFADYVARDREHLRHFLAWADRMHEKEAAEAWLRIFAQGVLDDTRRIYGIWDGDELTGGTMFGSITARFGSCEIGAWLSRDSGGRGLITTAVGHMIEWAIEERDLNRVEWKCEPENEPSRRVAQRLGMTREGLMRGAFKARGDYVDMELWALTAADWRARG